MRQLSEEEMEILKQMPANVAGVPQDDHEEKLEETLCENRTIFVVNHAEMPDDFFDHKIRVSLNNKKIDDWKKKEDVIVKASKYEKIF